MPEEQHSMRAREETRTVNDIRPSRIDRLNQDSIFSRVIFKIGVLNDDDVACSCRYARAQCGTFALIDFMIENSRARNCACGIEIAKNVAGSIFGTVIDNDDLFVIRRLFDALEDLVNRLLFVINRNDDR